MRLLIVMFLALSCGPVPVPERPAPEPYVLPDSEFLYWCVAPPGKVWPVYIDRPEDCENVSRGIFERERLPLKVYADEALMPEMASAIDVINDELGFKMFELMIIFDEDPDVIAMIGGSHPLAAAEAKHFSDSEGIHRGGILVYNGYEDRGRSDIMMHELGHIAGLRHDHDNRMSIMYTGEGDRLARLEKQDVIALRWLYGIE